MLFFTLDSHVYQQEYVIAKEEQVQTHFVTGAQSPFAGIKNLSIRDIISSPFLLTEKSMGYRRVFDEILASMSLEINPVLEIGRTDLITDSLEKGVGISFLPDFVTENQVKAGKLVYLDIADFKIDIWKQLIYHKNKWIPRHLNAFLQYVMKNEFQK